MHKIVIILLVLSAIFIAIYGSSCSDDDDDELPPPTVTSTATPGATPTPTPVIIDDIEANEVVIESFTVDRDWGYSGEWFTFAWETRNATSVELSPSFGEELPLSGQIEGQVWYDCSFTFTAYGYGGPKTEQLFINIISSSVLKTYGSQGLELSSCSIQQQQNGDFTIVGSGFYANEDSVSLYSLNVDREGNILNVRKQLVDTFTKYAEIREIDPSADGGNVILKYYNIMIDWPPPDWNYYNTIIKTDHDGSLMWAKFTFGSTLTGDGFEYKSLCPTTDNGVVAAGILQHYGIYFPFLRKFNASGEIQWEKRYSGSDFFFADFVQQTHDGEYILAGQSYFLPPANENRAGSIVKVHSDGTVHWRKLFLSEEASNSEFANIIQTKDLGYVAVGESIFVGDSEQEIILVKLDHAGQFLWTRSFKTNSHLNTIKSIIETADGGLVMMDRCLIKLDSNGMFQWGRTVPATLHSCIETADYLVATGETDSFNFNGTKVILVKIDKSGIVEDCSYLAPLTVAPGRSVKAVFHHSLESITSTGLTEDRMFNDPSATSLTEHLLCPE